MKSCLIFTQKISAIFFETNYCIVLRALPSVAHLHDSCKIFTAHVDEYFDSILFRICGCETLRGFQALYERVYRLIEKMRHEIMPHLFTSFF